MRMLITGSDCRGVTREIARERPICPRTWRSIFLHELNILGQPNPNRGETQTCLQLHRITMSKSSEYKYFNEENPDYPSLGGLSVDDLLLDWANLRTKPRSFDGVRWPKIDPSHCKFCENRYSLTCILAMLPDQDKCEKLCNLFFATVFPIMPLLHLPSFADDFRSFCEETASSRGHDLEVGPALRKNPGFVCLLSSILFTTLASVSHCD